MNKKENKLVDYLVKYNKINAMTYTKNLNDSICIDGYITKRYLNNYDNKVINKYKKELEEKINKFFDHFYEIDKAIDNYFHREPHKKPVDMFLDEVRKGILEIVNDKKVDPKKEK